MKNIGNKIFKILVCCIIIISTFLYVVCDATTNSTYSKMAKKSTPTVDSSEKIYDFAKLLTEEEKQGLYKEMQVFIKKYNMDIAVVTINENPKDSSMNFADDFYDYNEFGIGKDKSGLLFLIDMDKRVMWISTTGKAIQVYSDKIIDNILDYTYKKISQKDYKGCAETFIYYANYYADYYVEKNKIGKNPIYYLKEILIMSLEISTVPTIIFLIIGFSTHKKIVRKRDANEYVKGKLKIIEKSDEFVKKHVSRRYIQERTTYGISERSRSSSESTTHTGSSGTTHGGGGRSF